MTVLRKLFSPTRWSLKKMPPLPPAVMTVTLTFPAVPATTIVMLTRLPPNQL